MVQGGLPLVRGRGFCLWSAGGGGGLPLVSGVSASGWGCLPLVRGVSASGLGVSASGPRGCLPLVGECLPLVGECLPLVWGGVCNWSGDGGCLPLVQGGQVSASGPERVSARHTPFLWTEFLTHACENITLPQLRCGR